MSKKGKFSARIKKDVFSKEYEEIFSDEKNADNKIANDKLATIEQGGDVARKEKVENIDEEKPSVKSEDKRKKVRWDCLIEEDLDYLVRKYLFDNHKNKVTKTMLVTEALQDFFSKKKYK